MMSYYIVMISCKGWVEAGEFIVYIDESTDHLQTAFEALKKWKE